MSVTTIDRGPVTLGLSDSGLKPNCLSFSGVLGQSIAHISPTLTPTMLVPLVFASAGCGTWLAYVFATLVLVLVGTNVNHFARESANSGALYAYIGTAMGPVLGVLCGCAMVYASVTTAVSVFAGSLNYQVILLKQMGLNVPPIVLCVLGVGLAWYIAYRDIRLSAKIMLVLQFLSVGAIFVVCFAVLAKHGFKIDLSQFSLKGVTPAGMRLGLVLAFFSYVGFESATTLGDEAKNPLRTIPRAVLMSAIIAGAIFTFSAYCQILGFQGMATTLDKSTAPMNDIATNMGIPFFGPMISVGAVISMWACLLAALIAASHILFAMGRHGIFHKSVGDAHSSNETPHVAVHICAGAIMAITGGLILGKAGLFDICGWLGSLSTYGFLVGYILVAIAGPIYTKSKGKLKAWHIVVSALAVVGCVVPLVGSVYPVPAAPLNWFPYAFLGYMVLCAIWLLGLRARSPRLLSEIHSDLVACEGGGQTAEVCAAI